MKQKFDIALCLVAIVGAFFAYKLANPKEMATTLAEANSIATPSAPEEISVQHEAVPDRLNEILQPVIEPVPESVIQTPRFNLVLPTENEQLFAEPSQFYMHTNRYKDGVNLRPWQGGMYGFSRTPINTKIGKVYTKLHEGMDIKPLKRDAKGEPLDEVFAISDGEVVYVNTSAGRSNYGKYIVVKHDWPDGSFYSLYAHLAKTTVGYGEPLKAGDKLGVMGYTGAGIDKERAHVHVELAFMANPRYNTSFRKNNGHLNFNGRNLIALDVARLFRKYSKDPYFSIQEFLAEEEPYFTVRTRRGTRPEILNRHPWLGVDMELAPESKSWEVTFARSGVPLSIRPTTKPNKYNHVTWVKDSGTNHSYMTAGRVLGSGSKAKLSSSGYQFIDLICDTF